MPVVPEPVYPITHVPDPRRFNHVEQVQQFLKAGIRFFQVRDKEQEDLDLYRQLLQIRKLCDQAGARFVVNDRVDLALACRADGVHLGQTDLPVTVARELMGPQAIIGISTHNWEQFLEALTLPVQYVALGPVFPTSTKDSGDSPLGPELVGRAALRSPLPLVGIGGISLANAAAVWQAGAASVAVISDVVLAADPAEQLSRYLQLRRSLGAARGGAKEEH